VPAAGRGRQSGLDGLVEVAANVEQPAQRVFATLVVQRLSAPSGGELDLREVQAAPSTAAPTARPSYRAGFGLTIRSAEGGTRTHTTLRSPDFESGASTGSATSALRTQGT
jgi:hypothetical protein